MARTITAQACAKAILFGEYSVVFGHPAIAIPIPELQVKVSIKQSSLDTDIVIFSATTGETIALTDRYIDHPLYKLIHIILNELGCTKLQSSITISSTIPVAAGLGSSASLAVALVRALCNLFDIPVTVERISMIAHEVDKLFHGRPSGIDNTVIAYEQPIYFVPGFNAQVFSVEYPFAFLIADTGVKASTKSAIEALDKLRKQEPIHVDNILSEMGQIGKTGYDALLKGDLTAVGAAMNRNQYLLEQLSASSFELNRILNAVAEVGVYGAKLTGKGRGGNALILIDPSRLSEIRHTILKAGAAAVYLTQLGPVQDMGL